MKTRLQDPHGVASTPPYLNLKTAVPKEEVHEFCAHLQGLNQERNRIVHSAWAWDDDLVQRYKRTARGSGGFSLNVSDVDINEIRRFGLEIGEAVKKLWEVVPLEDEPAAGEG